MNLAVITARGGSKRIPRKNIKNFCGKPIIAYSIEVALKSHCFDEVMVSTDDLEIAKIAQEYGACVPFMRSAETANDFATTADVLLEVIDQYQKKGVNPEFICCLFPTAPFITTHSLISGFRQLQENKNIDTIFPIVRFSFPIQRALRLTNNQLTYFNPGCALLRSQDLEPAYHDAGQFYWYRVQTCIKNKFSLNDRASGIILSESQAQDIDNDDDWILAEMKYRNSQTQ